MPPASGNWLSTLGFQFPSDAFSSDVGIDSQQGFFSDVLSGESGAQDLFSLFSSEPVGAPANIANNPYAGPSLVSTSAFQNAWNTENPGEFNDFPFNTGGDYISATDLADYGGDLGYGNEYTGMEFQDQAQYDFWGSINEQLKLFTPENLSNTTYGNYDAFRDFSRGKIMPTLLRQLRHGVNLGTGGRSSNLHTGREKVFQNRLQDKYRDFMSKAENDIGRNVNQWRDMLGNSWNTMMSQGEYLQNTYNPGDEDE